MVQGGSSFDRLFRGELTRRQMLRRALALGVGASGVGAILASCGGGGGATPTEGAAQPTATSAGASGLGSPTAAAGATPTGTSQAGGQAFNVEEAKHKGGTLIEGSFADAKTLNPILVSDTASGAVTDLIFEPVVEVDPQSVQPKGRLAEKWDISSDGLTYTFNLRQGINWQDGQPLTANDVKFTYDLFMNKATKSPRTSEMTERVKTVEVVDDHTVKFTLNAPAAPFLVDQMVYGIVP